MTVQIFKKIRFVWKKLLESKAFLSSHIFHTNPLNVQKIQTVVLFSFKGLKQTWSLWYFYVLFPFLAFFKA